MNPLSRLLAAILAVLAMVGAFFFGIVILAVLIGAGVLAWLAFWLRVWWLRRRVQPNGAGSGPTKSSGESIDAEYTVISRRRD